VRIGDVCPGHAHHVELALGDGVTCRRHVADPGGMKNREPGRMTYFPGEVQVRCGNHSVGRDHFRQGRIGFDVTADDVEKIDVPTGRQLFRNRNAFFPGESFFPVFIRHHAHANDELRPHRGTDPLEHVEGEAQPIVQRAVVFIAPLIGRRRPESIHEMPVGFQLDAVHARRLHARRRIGVFPDDTIQIPVLRFLGKGAMGRFAHRRGREYRQPVAGAPAGAPAQMRQLNHDRSAVFMALVAKTPQPRHDGVVIGLEIAERRRRILGDHGGSGSHGERDTPLCLLHVIKAVAIRRHAVLGIGRLVGRGHDAVSQRQLLQLVRL
jgi:hypothetical protein